MWPAHSSKVEAVFTPVARHPSATILAIGPALLRSARLRPWSTQISSSVSFLICPGGAPAVKHQNVPDLAIVLINFWPRRWPINPVASQSLLLLKKEMAHRIREHLAPWDSTLQLEPHRSNPHQILPWLRFQHGLNRHGGPQLSSHSPPILLAKCLLYWQTCTGVFAP